MYLTDFREEALVDVIESLDTQLFERVTGLTLEDFHKLAEVGVFHPAHMNEAIWQFRLFERASLDYLRNRATRRSANPRGPVGMFMQRLPSRSRRIRVVAPGSFVALKSLPEKPSLLVGATRRAGSQPP